MIYDVAVVGAGPTGSTTAYIAAKKGLKTIIMEEDAEIGRPLHCTGKLTARAFQEFNLPKECIQNSVRGAVFYSPRNIQLDICKKNVESHIINREIFDQKLAERAFDVGAELSLGKKVYRINSFEGFKVLKLKGKNGASEIAAKLVVNAEGASPSLLNKAHSSRIKTYLSGLQYEMSNVDHDKSDYVELYFGEKYAPGFFAWLVPLNEEEARIGLCVREDLAKHSAQKYLSFFVKNHPILSRKTKNGKIKKTFGGRIPLHGPIAKTYEDNLLFVGDAAGHVKSTSGGGIYFGLKAAELAGEVAVRCLESGKLSAKCLKEYERQWKSSFGKELSFTSRVRRILSTLSDRDLDFFFRLYMKDDKLRYDIEKHGDTAYQSRLLKPLMFKTMRTLMQNPANFRLFLKVTLTGLFNMAK
ncbi:MAG: NAD(P)/FAD-dependent oxidoreductase [Candidatus Bathyarchaeota archaeon]